MRETEPVIGMRVAKVDVLGGLHKYGIIVDLGDLFGTPAFSVQWDQPK